MFDIAALLHQLTPMMGWRALAAFLLCAVLIPISLPIARRYGLVDRPGGRKLHECATPVSGGLCILISIVAVGLAFDPMPWLRLPVFFTCIGLLVAVGVWDDLRDISWRIRLLVQVAVAVLMVEWAGLEVRNLHDVFGIDTLGLLTLPFTIFVVVGVINALNMADGVDGLAGGQAVVSLLLLAGFALYAGDLLAVERLLSITAAVAGFLLWNSRFPWQRRARVFLGDAGSMLIGFAIAWYAIRLGQNPAHPVSPVLGPWTIALPLIDCTVLMVRRWRQGRSPFAADRNHLHHLLLDAGYSPAAIAFGLAVVSLLLGLGAALAVKLGVYRPLLVLAFLVLWFAYYALTCERDRAVRCFRAIHPGRRRLAQPLPSLHP